MVFLEDSDHRQQLLTDNNRNGGGGGDAATCILSIVVGSRREEKIFLSFFLFLFCCSTNGIQNQKVASGSSTNSSIGSKFANSSPKFGFEEIEDHLFATAEAAANEKKKHSGRPSKSSLQK